ncbi:cytochrome c oxidase accessory protein CcoG [Acidovorax sp. Be4]|uniref:Cytochrome c oxidase accessory protein CcoG n=1 Tax=Acidovorax bellezanensis TaxID=2976702 RepID=A0ABT2PRM2_9BURK|nr:cytochrome c oxidase accessory protein CcoG [Acidovorax sp. Be4]MCT9813126.1 cytochrome c oxidase accessory protein CcoG [Acidovorax sp. Be4]
MSDQPTSPRGKAPRKVIPIAAVPIEEHEQPLFEARKKIQPRSISGVFARWRWTMVWLTQLFFYGVPWLQINERQALLFDLEQRRFYIFGWLLYPQDFIYLTALLIISALALFLFTAVAGRLWCGFSCPQSVYTEIFMWIERKTEGDRSARLRLDHSGWTAEKLLKRGSKHLLWLAIALWTGFTFVGYFVPIRSLAVEVMALQGAWQIFWVLFYALATYGNAGFLREQVCTHMCPYARFQSAMFDRDTLLVTYDEARGENRGPRLKDVDYKAQGLGDCIDCKLCVQVCPVGIDIRDGLQYQCIGCGLCIDACNTVMDKMHYPRGLIRMSTENGMEKGWRGAQIVRRVFRPRVLIYGTVLLALTVAMVVSLYVRVPLKVDVVRDRGTLSRIVAGGQIENVYRVQLGNATEAPQHYQLSASGLDGLRVASETEVEVDAAADRWVVVRLQAPYGAAAPGSHPVQLEVRSLVDGAIQVQAKTTFLVPR